MDEISGNLQKLRIGTQIEREAEKLLCAEGITPDVPIVAEKCGVPSNGNVALTTNVYGVLMSQLPVYRYDVTIKASFTKKDGSVKWVDFTKKCNGDAIVIDRRTRCRDVFFAFQSLNKDFLRNSKCVYFDMQSILFSLNQLNVPADGKDVKFEIPCNELPAEFSSFSVCELLIRRVDENFQLALGDLSHLSRNLTLVEHSLAQFLDLATSQQIMFSPDEHITFSSSTSFLLNPTDHEFKDSDVAYFEDNGSYLAVGAKKSIRFVEGPNRSRNTALVVETKKTPFHIVESLLDKAKRIVRDINNVKNGDVAKLNASLSGLYVETTHLNRYQRFFVKDIDLESAKSKVITVGEDDMSVQEYFMRKYKINLQAPLAPLVRARGKENKVCYVPMELCMIVDNQRLKTNQQTPKQVQEMIKRCAIPPAILRIQNSNTFKSLHLTEQNGYLTNAGIKVIPNPLSLNGSVILPPDLQYGGGPQGVAKVRTDNFTWHGRRFLIPAACDKWAAFAFLGPRDRLNDTDFQSFIKRYVNDANAKGMKMSAPVAIRVLDINSLKHTMEEANRRGLKFIFAVHPDTSDEIHSNLKLYERQHEIVTQALRFSTLNNMIVKGQPMTLANIVFKTNIKLGGLNYSISINSPGASEVLKSGTLFIGISTNHPGFGIDGKYEDTTRSANNVTKSGKLLAPSIVGYSANYGLVDEFEFIGDFVCQEPLREEKVDVIRDIIHRCVKKYRANRKSEPKRILLYRNGCSEGQFAMVLKYEVPLIKLSLKNLKCNALLNIIVPNKLQSIRFFAKDINPRDRPADQNVKPGTVVDHSVVHPEFTEFFLTSHRALQGTAKTPKYTLLLNESKYTLQQLEAITYMLCYGHQIVQLTTSLPSPVYVAGRYAERGRKLYSSWPVSGNSSEFSYKDITKQLGYYGTNLENIRVNA